MIILAHIPKCIGLNTALGILGILLSAGRSKMQTKAKSTCFCKKNVNVIHLPMVFVIIPINLTSIFYNSRLIPEYHILVFGRNDK